MRLIIDEKDLKIDEQANELEFLSDQVKAKADMEQELTRLQSIAKREHEKRLELSS